ncbi:sporulation inhibitor KapD [Symmachiella dynata]|nr:sporulation inhibitor KapD [Symmachiella dynata]
MLVQAPAIKTVSHNTNVNFMDNIGHYLVVDLEATCSNDGSIPRDKMETIEIGAVMVEAESLQPVDEFQSFIRPVRYRQLSDFCRELTSITQQEVDAAEGFCQVFSRFVQWSVGFADPLFCSWGDYDRHQLRQDCAHHGTAYPFGDEHLNLKAQFSKNLGIRKRLGMAKAIRRIGLELTGTHHRGIDDARNIARLLPHIVR